MGSRVSKVEPPDQCIGEAVILSHAQYEPGWNMPPRAGNDADVENLQQVFSALGLAVSTHHDLRKQQVHEVLRVLSSGSPAAACPAPKCLVVTVMTHGTEEGKLCAYDSFYTTRDVCLPFSTSDRFKGVPKIFVFLACRGSDSVKKLYEGSGSESKNVAKWLKNRLSSRESEIASRGLPKIPLNPEFLIVFSGVEDMVGMRHTTRGTWFVQEFCRVVGEMTSSTDLLTLLTRVVGAVSELREISEGDGEFGQTPTFTSCLTRQLLVPLVGMPGTVNPQESRQRKAVSYNRSVSKRSSSFFSKTRKFKDAENDAACAIQPETVSEYPCERVQVHVLHTSAYSRQAQEVKSAFLNFCQEDQMAVAQLKGDEFLKYIDKLSKDSYDADCLIVVVLAYITEETQPGDIEPIAHWKVSSGKGFPLRSAWTPLIQTSQLWGKPKVFFFLDPLEIDRDSVGKLRKGGSIDEGAQGVNAFADFLLVFGFNEKFVANLCGQLDYSGQEILGLLTKVMQKCPANLPTTSERKIPHFESTLRYPLVLKFKQCFSDSMQDTIDNLRMQIDDLFDKEKYAVCVPLIDKKLELLKKLGCPQTGALNTKAMVLEHMNKFEESLVLLEEVICVEKQNEKLSKMELVLLLQRKTFLLVKTGRKEEAAKEMRDVLDIVSSVLKLESTNSGSLTTENFDELLTVLGLMLSTSKVENVGTEEDQMTTLTLKWNLLEKLHRFEEALEIVDTLSKLKASHGSFAESVELMETKAKLLVQLQRDTEALHLCDSMIASCVDTAQSVRFSALAAFILRKLGKQSEACKMLESILENELLFHELKNEEQIEIIQHLAELQTEFGNYEEALKHFQNIQENSESMEPLAGLQTKASIALTLENLGRYDESLLEYNTLIPASKTTLGQKHPLTLKSTTGKVRVAVELNQADPTLINLMEHVIYLQHEVLGADHEDVLSSEHVKARLFNSLGQHTEALEAMQELIQRAIHVFAGADSRTLSFQEETAELLASQGKFQAAESLIDEVIQGRIQILGDQHEHVARATKLRQDILDMAGESATKFAALLI